jgi:hypothetical protein
MNFRLLLLFFVVFASIQGYSQKIIEANRITEKIDIDGEATENVWEQASTAKDFIQFNPKPNSKPSQETQVKILYDDQALYIFAICFDHKDSVSAVLSERDDFNANTDNFQVIIDTYNDDINAFLFGVSSVGVQYDAKITSSTRDLSLNMVWSSKVIQTDTGWQLEMRIPYAAIRFSKEQFQDWGINFYRYISRFREESTWNPTQPDFDNWPAQAGSITGISNIKPPVRLALLPYVSGYLNNDGKNWMNSFNGGMDFKFGLNEAFTLDMTLVPDFGQVIFDNQVLNLSPFEIQFNENRQFFTEGTELFNKAGIFYSRRIGVQAPYEVLTTNLDSNEYLNSYASTSKLFNAAKFSGRTKKGLGIGIFNAVTDDQFGTAINAETGVQREIMISPITNFNVFVLDQNLRNNSSITLTNANVTRSGNFYDANVTALQTKLNTSSNNYFLSAKTVVSNKFVDHAISSGFNAGATIGKQTGNLIYSGAYFIESDTYNPNDLGFNSNNNKRIIDASIAYRIFKPFWRLNYFSSSLNFTYRRLYRPNTFNSAALSHSTIVKNKKFNAYGARTYYSFVESYDYFEPRVANRFFIRPKWVDLNLWFSSNYQKKFALDLSIGYIFVDREDWKESNYKISPRWRINDHLFLIYSFDQVYSFNSQGFALSFGIPETQWTGILFGKRDRINTTNSLQLQYTITNRMGITFRMRHYRSSVSYEEFLNLEEDGTLTPINYSGLTVDGISAYNANYNAFTIDFTYRWVFLPGSELNFTWKNSIFATDKMVDESYLQNTWNLFDYLPSNSFSLKILYWLDYQSLFKKKHEKK